MSNILSILNKSKASVTKPQHSASSGSRSSASSSPFKSPTISFGSKLPSHQIKFSDHIIKLTPKSPIQDLINSSEKLKIVSFDLDGTLITTKTNQKFATSPDDWKWFSPTVVSKLQTINTKETPIVIFTNQGGVVAGRTNKSFTNLITRIENILRELGKNEIDISNIWVYASPKKPASGTGKKKRHISVGVTSLHQLIDGIDAFEYMRKPNIGMFKQFERDLDRLVDVENSIYVGDAAGRMSDFSDSDKKFAENCGLEFKVPEDYF